MRILFEHIEAVLLQDGKWHGVDEGAHVGVEGGNIGDGDGNEESLGKVLTFQSNGIPTVAPVKAIHGYRLRE
jgi:hypothetical protein